MNYIINPSWFYWLGVVKSMRGFMLAALVDASDIQSFSRRQAFEESQFL